MELIDDPGLRDAVTTLFESNGALFGPPTVEVLERVRFSVIKLAMLGPESFALAARLYGVDTRDLLVQADFAHDLKAHEQWCTSTLRRQIFQR